MRRHTILGGTVIALAAFAGCYTGPTPGDGAGAPRTDLSATETASVEAPPADLPCDVASVLASACSSCHGATLSDGAPNHLASYADLAAPLGGDPSRTVADLCVARMREASRPMPPATAASPDAASVLERWIEAGLPEGTCSARGVDYGAPPVCTSKKKWAGRDRGSEEMRPGETCISCHKQKRGEGEEHAPVFSVAGTLYPTAHEPDGCNGIDGAKKRVTVVITDATGKSFELEVNRAGNFMSEEAMERPLRAKVVRGAMVYEMQGEIRDGDCNACHTQDGDLEDPERARGRVVLP